MLLDVLCKKVVSMKWIWKMLCIIFFSVDSGGAHWDSKASEKNTQSLFNFI